MVFWFFVWKRRFIINTLKEEKYMYEILEKEVLNKDVCKMIVYAPLIAKSAKAGQFIIIMSDKYSERIPFTIFYADKLKGSISFIYQKIGFSTIKLDFKNKGDYIENIVGPLGVPSKINENEKILIVCGGVGSAIVYFQAKEYLNSNCTVNIIAGFRNKDLIILEKEMKEIDKNLCIVTDDGSNGNKGFVTDVLTKYLHNNPVDRIVTVGPIPMMKAVCDITKKLGKKTIVSMNPIMIDGTGMCGGCRLTVGGVEKFACIDGPEFDGHEVNFDEVSKRNLTYHLEEERDMQKMCNLLKKG